MKKLTVLFLLALAAVSIILLTNFPVLYLSTAAIILGLGWNSLRKAPLYPPEYE